MAKEQRFDTADELAAILGLPDKGWIDDLPNCVVICCDEHPKGCFIVSQELDHQ